MISLDLARRLRDAGLVWHPCDGDRFFIPDRDLEGHTFSISDMSVGVRDVPGGREIAFNGAVEWALDAIMQREVVWLPAEAQLRERLGTAFVSLARHGAGYRCIITDPGGGSYDASSAADAYGSALLAWLESSPNVVPRLELDEL
ncbi:MAG TPA: pilus assembly protein CpaE [Acidimicrobiia bacterium]